ncbi:hypothetical protein H5410_026927 [Solanum commersonii]|uniref:At2g35280-like TPR domain-containing protein n=1 Tax=Solanum commersonii TaxID=4109 RepID=A0A9J5YXK2_SOLCO|nr:hypothetical protein H5410_026927 [Solanum commersonii]
MTLLQSQYGIDFGNQIYEYSSPYYSVEKYIIAYCEEIHPREIPPLYVDPSKPGRRRYKRWRGVGESFPTRKNKSKNYIESLPRCLLVDIVERINSGTLKDLMNVKLRVLNQVGNEPFVYQKFDFFNHNDPNALGMINQAADRGHIGASYVLSIISSFKDDKSMREGLMFIANMKKRSH